MGRSVALAYSIAGAAVAAAVIVIAGSTVGLGGGNEQDASLFAAAESASVDPAAVDAAIASGAARSEVVQTATGEQVEYVYVDAPAASGNYEDDDHEDHEDDEHEEREDHEEREHDDDD
ncbi:MAG: hypothetical protein Q7K37_07390 [Dehalococcoidia bacterium]|nr:hypothetical protein [Dehalococcoidia bacterium]